MKLKTLFLFLAIAIIAALGAGGAYLLFKDTTAPTITLSPEGGPVSMNTSFTATATDLGSGLKHVVVELSQNGAATILADQAVNKEQSWTETFTLPDKTLKQGPFTISVKATDASLANFGGGAAAARDYSFALDTRAPRVSLDSLAHNVNQGGSGLAVYNLDEEARSGVQVGERFFPGYKLDDGRYACFFAFPYSMSKDDFHPVLIAVDQAGNTRKRNLPSHAIAKRFRHDNLNIPDSFLESKMVQYEEIYPDEKSLIDVYLKVNGELRVKNRQELYDLGRASEGQMLWDGKAFKRMHNAATTATFGDQRSYLYHGEKVDNQTHLGVDLASVKNAPVEAANSGKVVRTGFFGIYGESVIIDHGMGLMTIYAHLSQIDVAPGDMVEKGQVIARSGATGLAGGDHLHFGVIVSGQPVNPIEWWDPHWIQDNVTLKLHPSDG